MAALEQRMRSKVGEPAFEGLCGGDRRGVGDRHRSSASSACAKAASAAAQAFSEHAAGDATQLSEVRRALRTKATAETGNSNCENLYGSIGPYGLKRCCRRFDCIGPNRPDNLVLCHSEKFGLGARASSPLSLGSKLQFRSG
jgi:hypothetical protein